MTELFMAIALWCGSPIIVARSATMEWAIPIKQVQDCRAKIIACHKDKKGNISDFNEMCFLATAGKDLGE